MTNGYTDQPEAREGIWCIVANVVEHHAFGEEQHVRLGTKHFSPNTKVYCFPPLWGDGYERIQVLGRHRGSPRLSTMIVPAKWLANWRVKFVFQPHVVERMKPGWEKETAEKMVASILLTAEAESARQKGFDKVSPDDALFYAARLGLATEARDALSRGASADRQREDAWGWTPLAIAAVYGHKEIVQLLLENGADKRVGTKHGETPKILAQRYSHMGIAELIKQASVPGYL